MVHAEQTFTDQLQLGHQALAQGNADLALQYWLLCEGCITRNMTAYRLLAQAFRMIGQLTRAKSLIEAALTIAPGDPLLISDLANILVDHGESAKAISLLSQLAKDCSTAGETEKSLAFLGNALMAMEYASEVHHVERTQATNRWGELAVEWAKSLIQQHGIPDWHPPTGDKGLTRIGFLSGDLCDHPVGFLLLPLLQHRTAASWQPYVYDNGSRHDQTHRQLRASVPTDFWQEVSPLSDAELIQQILADQLDILIDLSGHSGKSRLRVMAHRLAGKQFSWLGFSGSTGLPTIDGVILDACLAQNAEAQFCEQILEINPSRFCFRPPFAPPLTEPPCLKNGFVTFGCFNNTAKFNPPLLESWAEILRQTPGSQLLLKWRTLADPIFCNETRQTFSNLGIEKDRIILRGFSPHRQMLDEYREVDIALDTFPFNGGFTSLEALWMGLPLVTLAGNTPIRRQSASFLKTLALDSWIAETPAAYIRIASDLARTCSQNPAILLEIRQQQRYRMMGSTLYNATGFASQFESLMLQ